MAETSKKHAAPYASFSSFLSFLNKLQETGIPNRIDPTVFGNASGSLSYSIIAALKSLKLIDESGTPLPLFSELVLASEDGRKSIIRDVLKAGYPSLWNGAIDLKTATAGQFDEHIRNEFDAKGSTVDKVATFFIQAANFSDIPISPHLKARKLVASSNSSRKSAKQRKKTDGDEGNGSDADAAQRQQVPAPKPLEYQLIDLMSEPDIEDDVKQSIWALVQYLAKRKMKTQSPEIE